ncbi:unnamed protein product [Rotaria sordida]|uniref:Uncharacterized protein n=1 Tax=Rotaria sordida TaxID=392033 RepID=A0A819T597_9BILA|nr:unnamed protein product [Rotaria sordida]CAF4082380.1 unnamed protein product [Rotaria sordida]
MSIETKKIKILAQECRICGAPAEYEHFGVISCNPCKMFFKRNVNVKKDKLVCDFDGHCEININNRHICSACRLAKCLKCGMSTDKLQLPRQCKPKQNALVKVQTKNQLEKLPTLNLLQSDQSLLTLDQWTLLSNLFNCYKESQMLSFSQRLIDTQNMSQSTNKIYEELIEQFSLCIYETAAGYLRCNDDLRKLPFNDRSIMLRNASNTVSCVGGAFVIQHWGLCNMNAFLNAMNTRYGTRSMDIHIWAKKFIDPDVVLIKLAISLFAFSENTYCYYTNISQDLTNSIHILEIQNKYAELTWKYLLYKYGHYDAVKRFLNLTLWLLSIGMLTAHAQSLMLHVHDIDSVIEQTELQLVLDDVANIIETNQ